MFMVLKQVRCSSLVFLYVLHMFNVQMTDSTMACGNKRQARNSQFCSEPDIPAMQPIGALNGPIVGELMSGVYKPHQIPMPPITRRSLPPPPPPPITPTVTLSSTQGRTIVIYIQCCGATTTPQITTTTPQLTTTPEPTTTTPEPTTTTPEPTTTTPEPTTTTPEPTTTTPEPTTTTPEPTTTTPEPTTTTPEPTTTTPEPTTTTPEPTTTTPEPTTTTPEPTTTTPEPTTTTPEPTTTTPESTTTTPEPTTTTPEPTTTTPELNRSNLGESCNLTCNENLCGLSFPNGPYLFTSDRTDCAANMAPQFQFTTNEAGYETLSEDGEIVPSFSHITSYWFQDRSTFKICEFCVTVNSNTKRMKFIMDRMSADGTSIDHSVTVQTKRTKAIRNVLNGRPKGEICYTKNMPRIVQRLQIAQMRSDGESNLSCVKICYCTA